MAWINKYSTNTLPYYAITGGVPGPNGSWDGTTGIVQDWTNLSAWVLISETGFTPDPNAPYCVEATITASSYTLLGIQGGRCFTGSRLWMSDIPWNADWNRRSGCRSGFDMEFSTPNQTQYARVQTIPDEGLTAMGGGLDNLGTLYSCPLIARAYGNLSLDNIPLPGGDTLIAGDILGTYSLDNGITWTSLGADPINDWENFTAAGIFIKNTGWGLYSVSFTGIKIYQWELVPPVVSAQDPSDGETEVTQLASLSFTIDDALDYGSIVEASTNVYLEDELIYTNSTCADGWSLTLTAIDYGYEYEFTHAYSYYGGENTVRVTGLDGDGLTVDESWTFEVEAISTATSLEPISTISVDLAVDVYGHLKGFKWDNTAWPNDTQRHDSAVPVLYDALFSGISTDYWQSGIGGGDDLELVDIEDGYVFDDSIDLDVFSLPEED